MVDIREAGMMALYTSGPWVQPQLCDCLSGAIASATGSRKPWRVQDMPFQRHMPRA
jgi:hypothetical protein